MPSLSSLEFMVDHNAQLVPVFAALSQRLFRAGEWDSLMAPAGPFARGRPSIKCTPSRGTTSPSVTLGNPQVACCWGSALLSH